MTKTCTERCAAVHRLPGRLKQRLRRCEVRHERALNVNSVCLLVAHDWDRAAELSHIIQSKGEYAAVGTTHGVEVRTSTNLWKLPRG